MKLKQLNLLLIGIAAAFLLSCKQEPEFTHFGLWVEVEGEKIEIPRVPYNPILGGSNDLKRGALEVTLSATDKPTFYYYGDIPASALTFQEIQRHDSIIGTDIVPLEQAGAYKVTPKTGLNRGAYYKLMLAGQAYPLYISTTQTSLAEEDKHSLAVLTLEPMEMIRWTDGRTGCVSIERNGVSDKLTENLFGLAAWNCITGEKNASIVLEYNAALGALAPISKGALKPEDDMRVTFLSGKDIEVTVTDQFKKDKSYGFYFPSTVTRYYRQAIAE